MLICAYLAAVYLTGEARRSGDLALAEYFRTGALATGVVTGVAAVAALAVIGRDAEQLLLGLLDAALPLAATCVLAGTVSLWLLVARRYGLVRLIAAGAVTLLLVAWAAAQYPYILEHGVTVQEAAAGRSVLIAVLVSLAVGAAPWGRSGCRPAAGRCRGRALRAWRRSPLTMDRRCSPLRHS